MTTYTTKIAKNGSVRYYDAQTGKAIAKKTALENERNFIRTNGTTKERYELAKETYRVDSNGKIEKFGWHKELRRDSSGFYHVEVRGWYNHCGTDDYDFANDMQEEFGLTIDEFKAEAEANAEIKAEEKIEETAAKEIVEVEANSEEKIETKISANGSINFYNAETGKHIKEADAVSDAIKNGGTYYTASTLRYSGNFAEKFFASPVTAYKWLARTSDGSMAIDRCETLNGKEQSTRIYSSSCDGEIEILEDADLQAYLDKINGANDKNIEAEERETQIVLRMKQDNLTREQAEQIVDYVRANREHYNREVSNTVKKMLKSFQQANTEETTEETKSGIGDIFKAAVKTLGEEVSESDAKFEIGKTYFVMHFLTHQTDTITVEARTAQMLTGTTSEGTRKFRIFENVRGEFVQISPLS